MEAKQGKLYFLSDVAAMLDIAPHRIDHAIGTRKVCDPLILRGRRLFSLDDVLKLRAHFATRDDASAE